MKARLFFSLAAGVLLALVSSSCNKDCYNPSLEAAYANAVCPTDCPGVVGCDGKTYCNECEANRVGVAVE
jgi:hypothetical protein